MKQLLPFIAFLVSVPALAQAVESVTIQSAGDTNPGTVVNSASLFNGANMVLKLNGSGLLPTSPAFGTGFAAAAAQTINGTGGVITFSANGSTLPVRSGILIAGFSGPFESGTEKGNIGFSTDGINFVPVFGLEKYSPPLDGSSRPVGIRDTHLIKIGNYYLVTSTATYAGGNLEPYFDVARSTDLINWVNVASVTPSVGGRTSPGWFIDPPTGNVYVVIGDDPTLPIGITQNTSKDGVTWSGSVLLAKSGGGNINGSDVSMMNVGGTYYLFYKKSDNNYYYSTSASLTTGYTEIGLLGTSWPNAEGLCLIPTPEGIYRSYFNARSGALSGLTCYSTATSIAGTWSTPALVPTAFAASWDNASGFAVTDAGTFRDVQGASNRLLPYLITWGGQIGQSNALWNAQGNTQFVNSAKTGLGTISFSATTVTGVGTSFMAQCPIGTTLIVGSGTNRATVLTVASDTSLTIAENIGTVTSTAYTLLPPMQTLVADSGYCITTGDGKTLVTAAGNSNGGASFFYNNTGTIPWSWTPDTDGSIVLNRMDLGNRGQTLRVFKDAIAGGFKITSNGVSISGRIALNGAADDGTSAIKATGNGVFSGTLTDSGGFTLASRAPIASPTFTGNVTAPTLNGNTITTGSGTLTLGTGKTATVSNTLTFTGTDSSSVAFGAGGTVAYTSNNLSVFAATTSAQLAGIVSDETGSGSLVFGTAPTLAGDVTHSTGNIIFSTAGKSIQLKTGSNGRVGTGTLVGGTLAVANTSVTANSYILIQDTGGGIVANIGALYVASQTAGTGFTVTSSNAIDTSTFKYVIIETN